MDPDYDEGLWKRMMASIEATTKDLFDFNKALSVAFQNMSTLSTDLNKTFTQGRERITEMNYAIAQSGPMIVRLGGEVSDAGRTLEEISKATRRNVIGSVEDVQKLYSAGVLLDDYVQNIVGDFQDVGVQFSQVGKQLETSINYVRSVGGNAKQVMGDVSKNMEAMNRYNFSEGVLGLTKMATQASLLRSDMQLTLSLTDKAMDPEGAIELASAFQRLGVAAGDLVDPFQLMNKSINDPQGLQDSIINVAKQYSYFDEKSKTFRINPQGILMLREIEKQTGLSAKEMSKLAVNAADLDQKLSSLSPTIEFKNPEDKMYLANIAKMGSGGEYEVTINDKETRKLSEITQTELNKLITEQKKGPKSLEDLTRDQVDFTKLLTADLRAIRDKVVYGITSAEIIRKELEGLRRGTTGVTGVISEGLDQTAITNTIDETLSKLGDTVGKILSGDFDGDVKSVLKDMGKFLGEKYEDMQQGQKKMLGDILGKINPDSLSEKSLIEYILKPIEENVGSSRSGSARPSGLSPNASRTGTSSSSSLTESMSTIEIGGNGTPIVLKLDVPTGLSQEQFQKYIDSQGFSEKVVDMVMKHLKDKGLLK